LNNIADLAKEFHLVRANRIQGSDLRLFEFDYDLTWMAFFMNANGTIYGRYGGQDAKSDVGRMSLAGLRFAMKSALETHKNPPPQKALAGPPVMAENLVRGQGCIHCHNIHEAKWRLPTTRREDRWVYPLPDNIGIVLDIDQGNKVKTVVADSPAARVGIKPGDTIDTINGIRIFSFGDAQYALHNAPAKGPVPVTWTPARPMTTRLGATKAGASSPFLFIPGSKVSANLEVPDGWRKTNLTWRPSMLDLLPTSVFYGDDLTAAEKQALGLGEKRLAYKQDKIVNKEAQRIGVQPGDIYIGINGEKLEMEGLEFLGYIRRNFFKGDRVELNIIRNGKQLDLKVMLP
jgi:predicted metalloprotease with PDZ domain